MYANFHIRRTASRVRSTGAENLRVIKIKPSFSPDLFEEEPKICPEFEIFAFDIFKHEEQTTTWDVMQGYKRSVLVHCVQDGDLECKGKPTSSDKFELEFKNELIGPDSHTNKYKTFQYTFGPPAFPLPCGGPPHGGLPHGGLPKPLPVWMYAL